MLRRNFRKIFSRDRKTLYIILSIVLVSVFSLTIAYAALNTVLKITGNAEVIASSWDIHLDNVNVSIGSIKATTPLITSPTTATFQTTLTTPGDFYEFTIDVVNDGTIDAMIDGISKTPTLTETQAKYLNYIVEYQNGESINTKQLVYANSFVRLKVRIEFRKDITVSDLPTQAETLNLSFKVNYVQSDNTGSTVINGGVIKAKVENGTGTQVGDEICIGEECFYVISSTKNDVTMLSKYNLLVGNSFDNTNGVVPLKNITGIQDKNAIGWFEGYSENNPLIAIKTFSDTNYWADTVTSYPTYVYNQNSNLYTDYEKYKNYLENLGTTIKQIRPITIEELDGLGCSSSSKTCSGAPNWVHSTTYWTGTAAAENSVWFVGSRSGYNHNYFNHVTHGIRPVITIQKNEIIGIGKPIVNGSIDEIGTIVTIGTEQFYTIGTEGNNVKLLAKYNLHVGNIKDDVKGLIPLENPTGIQDENAKGYFSEHNAVNPIIGTKPFSSINYWESNENYPLYVYNENSYIYEYIENYKTYLNSFGAAISDARLINMEELEKLGCNSSSTTCKEAPSWVSSTTYWTGVANSIEHIWNVCSNEGLYSNIYTHTDIGVRPVIIISKSEF